MMPLHITPAKPYPTHPLTPSLIHPLPLQAHFSTLADTAVVNTFANGVARASAPSPSVPGTSASAQVSREPLNVVGASNKSNKQQALALMSCCA